MTTGSGCRTKMLTTHAVTAMVLAACAVALPGPASAAPLSSAECARLVRQVDGARADADLDVPRLIRDGDAEVAAAARRFEAIRSAVPRSEAALTNATQDLRYQLQVCARR
jgi:hypothetical protein